MQPFQCRDTLLKITVNLILVRHKSSLIVMELLRIVGGDDIQYPLSKQGKDNFDNETCI
jgi:hypothetical protein